MKALKKSIVWITVLSLLFALVSCGADPDSGSVRVVLESMNSEDGTPLTSYEVDLEKVEDGGLVGVLQYLKDNENIAFSMSGTMIEEVGSLYNDYAAGRYIYLFTSVERDFDVSEYKMTKEYEGKTLTSSGVGVSDMHLEDGCVIYIAAVSFG